MTRVTSDGTFGMKESLRVSVGAVVLALATLAAVIFAWLNFVQRSSYDLVDDGVAWTDNASGIEAWKVTPNSPAAAAGIRPGDQLIAIDDVSVPNEKHVAQRLFRAGLWTQLRYKLSRNGEEFETRLITAPAQKPLTVENYERVVGLLYLFIGLFIFIRRWNAPRAVHFYVFCLVSFVLYSFHYSGKLDIFDLEVYWAGVVAQMLAPTLLLHFALVFPGRSASGGKSVLKIAAIYAVPAALLTIHVLTAFNALGFVPSIRSRVALEQIEYSFLGVYFLAAGLVFYVSYRHTRSGVLRQQLKWLTGGTLAGSLPFTLFYVLPYLLDPQSRSWMQYSTITLVLIPLCFGYAIIRYRLMDVDIIFKRGLAYT
ncbi:MAG: PDZ domain-containing protein, partial [Candidatus Acidiferrum sp.]